MSLSVVYVPFYCIYWY